MDIDPGFGHWLAGFIDGEGCFAIATNSNRRYPSRCCHLRIQLRDDDTAILEAIRDKTGCGAIYHRTDGPYSPRSSWYCYSRPDAVAMVEILDRYPLRAKKARDFAIWREAVHVWTQTRRGPGTTPGNLVAWRRMAELQEALQRGRRYAGHSAVPVSEVIELDPVADLDQLVLDEGIELGDVLLVPLAED